MFQIWVHLGSIVDKPHSEDIGRMDSIGNVISVIPRQGEVVRCVERCSTIVVVVVGAIRPRQCLAHNGPWP